MVNPGGDPFDYDENLTPYAVAINDALDHPDVRVVGVKGNTRSAKTVSAENFVLRNYTYGPLTNVLWFMQDEDSIDDYIDERGEEMLRLHPEVNEKIDWADKRNGRKRKKIGKYLLLYRPATQRSLRAKASPVIIADEIDAYNKRVRDAIMTMITSRQEEFGNASKAYLCSHPDAGPDGGIDKVLEDSLLHLWFVRCPHCQGVSSPAAEVENWGSLRLTWNVPELMQLADEMDRVAFLDHVAENVVLCCPHDGCHATFDPSERLGLVRTGRWLQPHQRWLDDGAVEGETRVASTMGFVIHAFMSPFVKLHETARDWAAGKLTADASGNDVHLREVTVPPGVKFLTAFVDVQGDRFEVRVIGWDLGKQSWLVDAYPIKQWPAFGKRAAFENIDPGNRLLDWDIIEEAVLAASYPLSSNPQRVEAGLPELYLDIARTVVNSSGTPGTTNNARVWLSNLLSRQPGDGRLIQSYKVLLMQGSASKVGEIYGVPKQVAKDDKGHKLRVEIYERYPNVHEIKRIIAKRMKIAEPGPGRMRLPAAISPRYFQELTAERLVNGDWVGSSRRNETWDAWVACEVARATLQPDRPELWKGPELPEWACPRPRGQGIDSTASVPVSLFDRLAQLNDGGT
jgi:phage terminase large subunit GpA-like protein